MTAAAEKKEVTIGGAVGVPPAGAVALRSLTMRNVLSFGAEATVELGALNVLIGANGCGKSNLMDVVALLKAAATTDLSDEFRGKALEWPWKGGEKNMQIRVDSEWESALDIYCHAMTVGVHDIGSYSIDHETVDHHDFSGPPVARGEDAESRVSVLRMGTPLAIKPLRNSNVPDLEEDARKKLSVVAGSACVYRNRYIGRGVGRNSLRVAGRADGMKNWISESLDNFPLVLNRVYADSSAKSAIDEKMREFDDNASGIYFNVAHGTVEAVLQESGGRSVPASRMSDGMLNWLFLLTVLLDPNPPALVCIEEPETGLHPDMLPTLARMLIDASSRMQLIVTTHSDMIVDCFADLPEAVVVCDKEDGVTQMKRLAAEDFQDWKKEGLGMAWISGAIGGKRW